MPWTADPMPASTMIRNDTFIQRVTLLLASLLAGCASAPPAAQSPPATTPAATIAQPAVAVSASAAPTTGVDSPAPTDALAQRIDSLIDQPRFAAARWGIKVVSLDDGSTLYERDADKLFIPASNAKLYTTTLALDELGMHHRFTTTLYATARPNQRGVLHGDLVLVGGGDPSLGAGNDQTPPTAWADQLASVMAARGIRRITGNLIGDDTRYRGTPIGSGWEANDLMVAFAAPVSALSVQGNTFDVRVARRGRHCCEVSLNPDDAGVQIRNLTHAYDPGSGELPGVGLHRLPGSSTLYVYGNLPPGNGPRYFSLSAPDPALMAAALLRDAMARHGIRLDGGIGARHWPRESALATVAHPLRISSVRSPPLSELVAHTLKESDNLYAQLLLLATGQLQASRGICDSRTRPPRTTEGWGLCAMRDMLRRIGIADGQALLEEGTGLSRKDMVSPAATTRLLAWAARQPFATALRDALPVAGVDGTLERRLRNGDTFDNLTAKTGTLRYAYTLSGYVTDREGRHLAFSIMLNNYRAPTDADGKRSGPRPTAELDAIARAITDDGGAPASAIGATGPSRDAPALRSPAADVTPAPGTPATRQGPSTE